MLAAGRTSYVYGEENSVTVTSLGGKWEQSIREHFVPLFKERTGADVKIVLGGPPQWVSQIEAQPNRPPLDCIDNTETLALSLREKGMVLKLDTKSVPNLADTPAMYRDPFDNYGAGYSLTCSGIFYNKDKIKNPPKDLGGVLPARRGRRIRSQRNAARHHLWLGAASAMALCRHPGRQHRQPRPCFKSLVKLKPHVVKFWGTALEAERMILSKEADIGMLWDGRVYAIMDGGASHVGFTRLDPSTLVSMAVAQVVKGGNEKLAYQWVNTLLDPEPQLKYFKLISYTPTNSKVAIPPDQKYKLVPEGKGVIPPYPELIKAAPRMLQRWNREMRS